MTNEQLAEIRDKELNELRYDKLLCANAYNCPECKQTLLVIDKVQIATVNKVIEETGKLYDNFARDLRDITVKYLAIGKQLHYENHTDKLIKEYNLTLSQLKEQK